MNQLKISKVAITWNAQYEGMNNKVHRNYHSVELAGEQLVTLPEFASLRGWFLK